MPTNRRSFIKRGLTAASAGLLSGAVAAPSCDRSRLTADPDIRVLFSGLLLYRFTGGAYCDVDIPTWGMGHQASDHLFSIVVKARQGSKPPYTLWRYFGDQNTALEFGVEGATAQVSKYMPNGDDFKRKAGGNDDRDWQWTLRLDEFHRPVPGFDQSKLSTGIRINNGLFYTALRTDIHRTKVMYTRYGDTEEYPLYSVGSVVGANVYLDRGSKATLSQRNLPGSSPASNVAIEMSKSNDLRYEIYFEYDPPRPILPSSAGTDSHFYAYYDAILETERPSDPCRVKYYDAVPERANEIAFGTPDVPCMGLEG